MQKILYYVLLIAVLTACNKQGPDGPAGPEGPQGNPGPPGSSGGTGNGAVKAYTSQAAHVFRWKKNAFLTTGYTLERASSASSVNYDDGFYVDDRDGAIPEGVVLVYVKMKKNTSTQEAPWVAMPFIGGNNSTGEENYEAWMNYRDQTGNNDYLSVRIVADIQQTSPAAQKAPSYSASGLKVIVIPSGQVQIGGGSRAIDLKALSLEQVMERYQLKESDFKTME
ncbi:lipoprotein [Paraflavitalea pollutisoli]|uniref:lipoprotein n=1 Tax=Paraflavitalea pollutisoli TaxID=3034143 RepID=UPI0023ED1C62|nr:hypothetical protein [Paraflavitalea sp. H1-2-19X]